MTPSASEKPYTKPKTFNALGKFSRMREERAHARPVFGEIVIWNQEVREKSNEPMHNIVSRHQNGLPQVQAELKENPGG